MGVEVPFELDGLHFLKGLLLPTLRSRFGPETPVRPNIFSNLLILFYEAFVAVLDVLNLQPRIAQDDCPFGRGFC